MKIKFAAVALIVAVVTFALSRVIWPDPIGAPAPPDTLLPHFILISALESLITGIGVAFLLFAFPLVRRVAGSAALAWATYLLIGFILVSWWPHGNLHRVVGLDFGGLIAIEYAFHVPLIVAGAVVAYFFVTQLRQRTVS